MPIYEYQCKECGVRFERTQSFHDDPVRVCPECAGETQRLITSPGVVFKGSGFYVNDSRSSGKNVTSSSESKPDDSSTDSNSSDSDDG